MTWTAHQAKYFAHELTRRYASDNSAKLATALMDAQVDLNPHQVEAALFAFKSPFSKGAILADEVGLGKTIEAGLVLSQKWAEGKRRILIIAPSSLRKQWVQELHDKFYLPTIILEAKSYNDARRAGQRNPFETPAKKPSLVICSYQFAANKADDLMTLPWDLVVIDEAHRLRNVYKPGNKIGKALKTALSNAPKLLLTATPLQNSLMELYGLVSIIDDYAFGDAKSFRARYARVTYDVFDDLKARLAPLCHRTLRRQVLEYIRYTNRIPLMQEFVPTDDEQALYDMVSDYLQRPNLQALPNGQRKLMILVMRKLLASSTFAIAGALDSLLRKLEGQLKKDKQQNDRLSVRLDEAFSEDVETFEEMAEEWNSDEEEEEKPLTQDNIDAIQSEINDLRDFRDLAVSITENAKGTALLSALDAGFAKARELGSAEKVIIFTESRRTQEYLVRLLSKCGYNSDLVLFNGSNADTQSSAIYKAWALAHKGSDLVSGSRTADMRQALVDHFRSTAKIMIATEAAAEGINLQFCSMVVNFDLPWNPQRIEQRIGRCHRYGQQHDVVVVNFLNKNNAADQRVFELLAEKFSLFSGVFGASDEVLGAIESGVDFEKRIVDIYQNCRTPEAIESEFAKLRAEMDAEIDVTMKDTRQKLLENFDAEVHDRLRVNLRESREYLNKAEALLWDITCHGLGDHAAFDKEHLSFELSAVPSGFPAIVTGTYRLSRNADGADIHRYRLGHPLAQHLVHCAAQAPSPDTHIVFDYARWGTQAEILKGLRGQSGTLVLHKLAITGADAEDHLIFAGQTVDGTQITDEQARRLMTLPAYQEMQDAVKVPSTVQGSINDRKSEILRGISERQSVWFDEEMVKLDKWADDKRSTLKVNLRDMDDELKEIKKSIRSAANLPDKIALQRKAKKLEQNRDEAWRDYDDGARDIERLKDELIDRVEARLSQDVEEERLFSIYWTLI